MAFAAVGKLIRRFNSDQRGAVALIAGLAVLPMIAVAGMTVDYVRASGFKTRLQSSLDAAALAAATTGSFTNGERIKLANAVFAKNWADTTTSGMTATPKFSIDKDGIVATATVNVPAAFMRIAGIDTMPVGSEVNIAIPKMKKAEVAMVLDYSESMTEVSGGKVKYVAMRDAATKLIEDLKATGQKRVKIGLVPFSHHVRVTLPKAYVAGESGSGNWTGCTQDRLYPYNISDDTPDEDDEDTKWNQSVLMIHGDCSGYAPRNLTIRPLTGDLDAVATQLGKMTPYKYTHIALGVEFGWHLLSPDAPFKEGAAYGDEGTQKFMVVLTDGKQTEPSFGRGGARNERWGERNLETLCQRAKDKGITMITIAFDLEDKATTDRLRDCSTDPDKNFFIAEDDSDISRAFEEITNQVTAQIYVSK